MRDFSEMPLPPRVHEVFKPAERAADMAQVILDRIGSVPPETADSQRATSAVKWNPSVFMPFIYQLQRFDGASGKRYHFDVLARDESPLARYMIYIGGEKQSYIIQLDFDGDRIDLDRAAEGAMHAKVLGLLTSSVPSEAHEITKRYMNDEFNALMGRFIISDFALEIDGKVQAVDTGAALHAAEAHRQGYDRIMFFHGSPRTDAQDEDSSKDSNRTQSFELAATRAAVDIGHKWQNSFNRDTPPEQRIQRSS